MSFLGHCWKAISWFIRHPNCLFMKKQLSHQWEFDFSFKWNKTEKSVQSISTLSPVKLSIEEQQKVIRLAVEIIQQNFHHGELLSSPTAVTDHLQVLLAERKDEVFCMLFLDNRHRIIAFEELFQGTIDGASVHPRVIVRRALELNAAAGIMVHNHPSWVAEPSQADIKITDRVKSALGLVDVRILDHIVVSTEWTVSLAERGLI